jgi:hypothetical protein
MHFKFLPVTDCQLAGNQIEFNDNINDYSCYIIIIIIGSGGGIIIIIIK